MVASMVWSSRLFAISAPVMSSPEIPLARRASRIVDVDARISQRASGWASELLDFITARPKHREQTV